MVRVRTVLPMGVDSTARIGEDRWLVVRKVTRFSCRRLGSSLRIYIRGAIIHHTTAPRAATPASFASGGARGRGAREGLAGVTREGLVVSCYSLEVEMVQVRKLFENISSVSGADAVLPRDWVAIQA